MSRVLIVDDDSDILGLLRTASRFCNWQWEFAKCGVEALRLYEQARIDRAPYDLIILDIAMPDLCGLEVARAIRQRGDDKTKIIFYTAYGGVVNKQTASDLGGRYVEKTISPFELQNIIEAEVAGKEMADQE